MSVSDQSPYDIPRRKPREFFTSTMKEDIKSLSWDWFHKFSSTRKDKDREEYFRKAFAKFQAKHEHAFHPDDRKDLRAVSMANILNAAC